MIKNEIDNLLKNYIKWLKDKTIVKQIREDWVEITIKPILWSEREQIKNELAA